HLRQEIPSTVGTNDADRRDRSDNSKLVNNPRDRTVSQNTPPGYNDL
ncbi:4355_t:CDS:1, partial [Ambispora leptoticha]